MRPRALLTLLITNILVAVAVAVAFLTVMGPGDTPEVTRFATFVVVVTATRDPNATIPVQIITATPQPGQIAALPSDVAADLGVRPNVTVTEALPETTIDPAVLEANPGLGSTVAALPSNCIPHTLAEGENPSILSETYGTDMNSILLVNGLTEDDAAFLQIGQVLIVPLTGCSLLETAAAASVDTAAGSDAETAGETSEATPEVTLEATLTPTITPTITLAPTAVDAQVQIVRVDGAGDVTAEQVLLRNNGRVVNLEGWTLSDGEGNTYTFSARNLFTNGEITVRTGTGDDTPVVLFWDRTAAVFGEPGEVAVLSNAAGEVQAVLRMSNPVSLGN